MSEFAGIVQDELRDLRGNAMQGAVVVVRDAGTTTPATVFNNAVRISGATGGDSLANDATTGLPAASGLLLPGVDANGNYTFFADSDAEYDLHVTWHGQTYDYRVRPKVIIDGPGDIEALKTALSGTYVQPGDDISPGSGPTIDLRRFLTDGASNTSNGAANLAGLAAAITAAPEGATLRLPKATTGWYVERTTAGTIMTVNKTLRLELAPGALLKFGPESAAFGIIGFSVATGKTLEISGLGTIEGPTLPNAQVHIGVLHETGTGQVIVSSGTRLTKWAQCVKADGDTTTVNSSIDVLVGDNCYLESNGLGNCVLHNGGTFQSARSSKFDMIGGSNLAHSLYLAVHVAADIDGTFLHAGGYNVHPLGGANQRPAYFVVRAKFLGDPGTAAVLGHPLAVTQIATGAVFGNTTGAGIVTQAETVVAPGVVFATPNATIAAAAAAAAHTVRLNDVECRSRVVAAVAGVTFKIRGGRYEPSENIDPFNLSAGILDIDGAELVFASTNGQQIRASAGALRVNRTFFNNAAQPTYLFSASGPFTQAHVGAAVTVTGAGAAGATLTTTIVRVISAKKAILAAAASTVVTTGTVTIAGVQVATDGTMDTRSPRGIYATGATTTVEGDGNRWAVVAGRGWLGDSNSLGKLTPKRGIGSAVASAASLVLDPNFDTFHITGTTTIDNMYVDTNVADVQRLHNYRVQLIADAAWSTSAAGNITPKSTAARAVGAMVVLQYDPATAKWYEAA